MTWYVVEVEQVSTKLYMVNALSEDAAALSFFKDEDACIEQDEFIESERVISVRREDDRWDDDEPLQPEEYEADAYEQSSV